MPLDSPAVDEGLSRAFHDFLTAYAKKGGHKFPGFEGYGKPRNYKGPLIWSEGDCQFRLALALG